MRKFVFVDKEGVEIHGRAYEVDKPVAMVQVLHGMSECSSRYEEFCLFLNRHNFSVYTYDHRGHGESLLDGHNFGYMSDVNNFDAMLENIYDINKMMTEVNSAIPIFLIAHSMGSFLAQKYIQKYGETIKGVILLGSSGRVDKRLNIVLFLSWLQMKIMGRSSKAKLIESIVFGEYNRKFKPNRTKFDWLSRDNKEVDKYIDNKYCGHSFSCSFYYDFFNMLKEIVEPQNIKKIPKNLSVLLLSGEEDPINQGGDGIVELYYLYTFAGIDNVGFTVYHGARHELLNELNKDEVKNDILEWLDANLAKEEIA